MPHRLNLFHWATSELSQDAFICWLLSWVNSEEQDSLKETALFLIDQLTDGKIPAAKKVEIYKQYKRWTSCAR